MTKQDRRPPYGAEFRQELLRVARTVRRENREFRRVRNFLIEENNPQDAEKLDAGIASNHEVYALYRADMIEREQDRMAKLPARPLVN